MPALYPSYFITGASSGIGQSLAVELARRAAAKSAPLALALLGRRMHALEETRAQVLAAYPNANIHLHVLDINESYGAIEAAINASANALGVLLHCFIINAGVAGMPRPVGSATRFEEDVRSVAVTNFVSTIACIDAAVKYIREHKVNTTREQAHIVGMSSVAGSIDVPYQAVYSASKAGLDTYLRTLSLETTGQGIHITSIKPGYIDTPINGGKNAERPFVITPLAGSKTMADRIAARSASAFVPWFPWAIASLVVKMLPKWLVLRVVASRLERVKDV
ncbi:hypothetical protein BC828DRAFT_261877 [Blastocladiella britannica]|nr:hypothetical protein BC828DRAFT_261877 [Blastocladiella britannica]